MAESPVPTKYSVYGYKYITPPNVLPALEGTTSGSFKKGDLVRFDADGRIVIGVTTDIYAIALNDYTGTAGTAMSIEVLSPENFYVMRAASGATTVQTECGGSAVITFTTGGGAHYITVGTTGAHDCIVRQLHPEDGAKAGGRYIVQFEATALDTGV